MNNISEKLRVWYPMDDINAPGKDISGNRLDAMPMGKAAPYVEDVHGRKAVVFAGGSHGSSYMKLPEQVLEGINDNTGFTVCLWVCGYKAENAWERIFDFGQEDGPFIYMTRELRGDCYYKEDFFADVGKMCPTDEWAHIVFTVTGTEDGTLSSAGPRMYVNGELIADGWISQTSSGKYKKYRKWLETLTWEHAYPNCFIGSSQFDADPDFHGALADFRIYNTVLDQDEIIEIMCAALEPEQILKLAKNHYLPKPRKMTSTDIDLPTSLMRGRVSVHWTSYSPDVITNDGKVTVQEKPTGVVLNAELYCGTEMVQKTFTITVIPKHIPPCEITVHADREVLDISPTLYGLFFEDINHAADGGIYAEMIQNRSFENFKFNGYNSKSGKNGSYQGKKRMPLQFWFGDTDKVTVRTTGGLNEHFGLEDPEANACYIEVPAGVKLYNHGFCDKTMNCAMNLKKGEEYYFSIWAKPQGDASVKITLLDPQGAPLSVTKEITFYKKGVWYKYEGTLSVVKDSYGQIELEFTGDTAIDMVSMMPEWVWGAKEEATSVTAHNNFRGNPNYRLRRDMVEVLRDLHPRFLRFPGGCISEGSYIWENVYDWKDSVGPVEVRKENYNVWAYNMTLGLGYMEYFQLAEDLNAEPLPVMACGVLCQARSDYANPAGGALREKYISNFIDLIDFAISKDFEHNKWARIRKEMGHPAPFGLHYLGVGNENWGTEFFANFEIFKHEIDEHMKRVYPGYTLHIVSTAGAQADDDKYQDGWRFLTGYQKGTEKIEFTDGKTSFEEEVSWYPYQKNYLDTIVDEHFYRSNDYLLENVDRYNYYYRPYKDGVLDEDQVSKVFVGEYASSDKNTLAGAVAEAALMTGFEKNSDVVRLAATAPLFNKVGVDGTYRWTPDAIWFDDDSIWRTPNYYVQQMFAKYIGTKLLDTTYKLYEYGKLEVQRPHGGVAIRSNGEVQFESLRIVSNETGEVLFEQDFHQPLSPLFKPMRKVEQGYYLDIPKWHDYTAELVVNRMNDSAEAGLAVGVCKEFFVSPTLRNASMLEYCVGKPCYGTGLRVIKNGLEAYTEGDYASSVYAGNMRACYDEVVPAGRYTLTVNYGCEDQKKIRCYYTSEDGIRHAYLENKLEVYIRDIYNSVTADDQNIYVKLVNADMESKSCRLNVEGANVLPQAKAVVLTGFRDQAYVPNINNKWSEPIVPVEGELEIEENAVALTLPGNSVTVLVMKKQ